MMGEARCRCLAFLVALLLAVCGATAARATGEVAGHVRDAQGQPLPGVSVKLLTAGETKTREQTSDAQGDFRFGGLASGVYVATAAKEGFRQVTCPGVRIIDSLSRNLAIELRPAEGERPSSCEPAAEPGEGPGRLKTAMHRGGGSETPR
jgi:hypothetical protein